MVAKGCHKEIPSLLAISGSINVFKLIDKNFQKKKKGKIKLRKLKIKRC